MNKKVLTKLRIHLTNEQIEDLAKSAPGAVEKLLHEVKQRVDEKQDKEKSTGEIYIVEGLSAQVTGNPPYSLH